MSRNMIVLATALGTLATAASAVEPATVPGNEKSVVLYVSKSFGGGRTRGATPLAFGLKLQQNASFDPRRKVAIADFRYSLGGTREIFSFGALAMRFDDRVGKPSSSSSSGVPISEHPVATGVVIGLGVLGLACATEIAFCKGRGSSYETPRDTPTTPGQG